MCIYASKSEKRATPVFHNRNNCFCRHKLQPPTHLIPVSFSADVLSCEGDYCASDKVFLSRRKVNVILVSDTATDRRKTGVLHELWSQLINLHWRMVSKKINKHTKDKTERRKKGEELGKDGSPASTTERTSYVIAAGRPRRTSSSDGMFTYLPWPAGPQGSRIITDKCYIFPLIWAPYRHVNHCSVGPATILSHI